MHNLGHTDTVPAAYRNQRRQALCPVCRKLMPITGGGKIEWHFVPPERGHRIMCKGAAQDAPTLEDADARPR